MNLSKDNLKCRARAGTKKKPVAYETRCRSTRFRRSNESSTGPNDHSFDVFGLINQSTVPLTQSLNQNVHNFVSFQATSLPFDIVDSNYERPASTTSEGPILNEDMDVPTSTQTEVSISKLNPEVDLSLCQQNKLTDCRSPLPSFCINKEVECQRGSETVQLFSSHNNNERGTHILDKVNCYSNLWSEQAMDQDLPSTLTYQQCLNIQPDHHDFCLNSSGEDFPPENSNAPIYKGARISVQESVLACIVFCQAENLKTSTLCRLLGLIEIHCLEENLIPKSGHYFFKQFEKVNSSFKVTYYCSLCWKDRKSSSDLCDTCFNPKRRVHYYVSCDINQQIASLFQRPEFVEGIKHRSNRCKKNENNIEDLYDGSIYLEAQRTILFGQYTITLMWYTDGIQLYESSTFSLWPFYFVVNELPLHLRFKQENIIFGGFWGSSTHPHPNIFLRETLVSMETLKHGVEMEIAGQSEKQTVKVFLLCGVADAPAKASFLNIKCHSGFSSCPKCTIVGEKSDRTNNVTVFPFQEDLEPRPSSNSLEYNRQVKEAMRTMESRQGIKGPTLLSYMLQPCMFKSTGIDAMHNVYMGVEKQLLNLLFNSKYSKLPFSLSKHVNNVNAIITNLSLPHFVQRLPVPIDQLSLWKASLLRNFFFYIMLPVFKVYMTKTYFDHLCLFVEGTYYLNRPSIAQTDPDKAKKMLIKFVRDFEILYGIRNMSLNVHLLMHLADSVRELGPLFVTACYDLEGLNGKIGNLAHGTKDACMQIGKRLRFFTGLPKIIEDMQPGIAKEFCENLTSFKGNRMHIADVIAPDLFAGGYYETPQPDSVIFPLAYSFVPYMYECKTFDKLSKDKILYVSSSYARSSVNDSSVAKYICRDGEVFGEIFTFAKVTTTQQENHYLAFLKRRAVESFLPDGRLAYMNKDMGEVGIDVIPVQNLLTVCFRINVLENVYLCETVNQFELE